jgi:DNA-binding Lrp family transcriptional regulator
MNRGYVRLWRKLEESAVFQNEGLLKVFLWCLLRANHKETFVRVKTGRGISEAKLFPGSFIFGRESAAERLNMKPSTAWKRILKLKKLEYLNIKSDSHYSIIYIINWDSYQAVPEKSNSEGDRQGTGKEHRQELKNNKNKTFSSDSIEIRLAEMLLEKIIFRLPGFKKPNIQNWAKDIDLMLRVDNREPSEISRVIEWCQKDQFWQSNILSTGKLRGQFDQLKAKMQSTGAINEIEKKAPPNVFECLQCGQRIIVKSDLTENGCVYCEVKK